ncbi:hypothetical protein RCL_jg20168.t1 [Rhizophagus clarus]|uniref:Reverse transcriptase domain-containing protein n=1 Tax=Rhizophagus clarus TaxID=94130 RepID=A0A8H3KTZ6_9GLOM|nr:hypothetical protein RCL_jg20168.t1 [Rhizophagus clarus]
MGDFNANLHLTKNRLDYIWVNADTLISTFDSKILDVNPSIKTDHRIIFIELLYEELFFIKTDPKPRKNPSHTIYSYKDMKAEEELNQIWNQFQNVILNSTKKNIKNRLSKKPARCHHPVRDSQLHHDITTFKGMITKSKNSNLDFDDRSTNGINRIIEFITRKHTRHDGSINDNHTELTIIMSRHNIAYTNNNIRNKPSDFLHKLQSTLATLKVKFYYKYYKYHKWLIESFVDERNDNYKNDKKKMINSITEKHIKSITIDKVYCNANAEDILYTDIIHIHDTIYADLLTYPLLEDWIEIINNLPNDKASGPSGISYEMLKHLNKTNQSVFHAFICVCIDLGTIPDAWKKAMVYPIPKPKPFFTSLTNTRPITLLETPCKAFISLLNKRLNAVIKQYNIFRGHQFAALPVESRKLGYTIKALSINLNNNPGDDFNQVDESLMISSIAFMDDT